MPTAVSTETELTNALQALQNLSQSKRTVWGTPVPWVAEPVFVQGYQVAPAYSTGANQVIICSYRVPRGYTALICGLVLGYVGGAGPALPGQILYTVDVTNPYGPVSPQSGYIEKDYNQVPFQLGDLVGGPVWPVEFRHDQGETVRIKGFTVAGVATGVGNFLYGALIGFQWPTMGWEA